MKRGRPSVPPIVRCCSARARFSRSDRIDLDYSFFGAATLR
ncbi:uncharacterized protein BCN122_I0159 [Burkholderia cenocepacia]|nr:uncharacterized protein BCN122_I0159 [Burkholderia cenocepacia]